MNDLEIIVTSQDEAIDLLDTPSSCSDVGFVISIGDPESDPPRGLRHVDQKLRLVFYDTHDEVGPTENDVRRIIDFARTIAERPAKVLTHCQAGISRSTAAAFIVYAVAFGEGREMEALERVYAQRPIASPNRRMVAMADRLLQRGGAMIKALENRQHYTPTV